MIESPEINNILTKVRSFRKNYISKYRELPVSMIVSKQEFDLIKKTFKAKFLYGVELIPKNN